MRKTNTRQFYPEVRCSLSFHRMRSFNGGSFRFPLALGHICDVQLAIEAASLPIILPALAIIEVANPGSGEC